MRGFVLFDISFIHFYQYWILDSGYWTTPNIGYWTTSVKMTNYY